MYYIGLNEKLNILKVTNTQISDFYYVLTTSNIDLFNFLNKVHLNDIIINYDRFINDLSKRKNIKQTFNSLNNNFEHLLLYIDVPEKNRTELNQIILNIIWKNLQDKKEYYDNDKCNLLNTYLNETYFKCKKILENALNSDYLLDHYLSFIYLKFNEESKYINTKQKYVLHCPGLNKSQDLNIINLFNNHTSNIKIQDTISVCTVATTDLIPRSPIINQFKNTELNLLISDRALTITKEKWKRYSKLECIIDVLQKCKTEYALIVDGSDTIILNDLDNNFITLFKNINVPFIFNSDNYKFPCYEIEPFDFMYENRFDRYLNGGVVFGYTTKLLEFYSLAYNLMLSQNNKINSEQFYLRSALTKYEKGLYCIDYSQELFLKCSVKNNFKYKLVDNNIYLWDYRSYINWIPYEGINDSECNYLLV